VFERFTDRARQVVVLAQEEARLLSHNYIGTEHILLGLIHEGEGVAAKALESLGISLEAVRAQVEEIIGRGGSAPSGYIPFTPRAKKVLELSLREALPLGHNYIGTEHILLGLIREGQGVAAQVLVKLGGDLSRVRQRVIQLQSDDAGAMLHSEPAITASSMPLVGFRQGWGFGGGSRRCSFCGRREESVTHLVRAREAYICDACIALAHEAASAAPDDERLVRIRPRPTLPSDRDAAEDEIVRAFYTVYGGEASDEERCASIEGGSNLGPTLREAEQRRPWPARIDISIDSVRFIAENEAEVHFVLLLPQGPMMRVPYTGHAILVDGAWKVARSTYCDLVSRIGVQCPPPP
jgi:hypothetical protein